VENSGGPQLSAEWGTGTINPDGSLTLDYQQANASHIVNDGAVTEVTVDPTTDHHFGVDWQAVTTAVEAFQPPSDPTLAPDPLRFFHHDGLL
jgi:hypothetical protein